MIKVLTAATIVVLLHGCSSETDGNADKTLDVTPGNAKNLVEQTESQVDALVQQNKESLDAAIDAQTAQ